MRKIKSCFSQFHLTSNFYSQKLKWVPFIFTLIKEIDCMIWKLLAKIFQKVQWKKSHSFLINDAFLQIFKCNQYEIFYSVK